MEILIPVGIIAFIAIIILVAIAAKKAREKRIAELQALADSRGLTLYPNGIESSTGGFFDNFENSEAGQLIAPFANLEPFDPENSRSIDMLLTGQSGELFWNIFEYSYVTESTSTDSEGRTTTSRTTHRFTIHAAACPLFLPWIDIRREGFFDKIGKAFGGQDMDFELEAFNRRYRVRSGDPKICHGLLHPEAMEFLMSIPDRHWQISGNWIVVVDSGTIPVPEIYRTIADIESLYALTPTYLKQDLSAPNSHLSS